MKLHSSWAKVSNKLNSTKFLCIQEEKTWHYKKKTFKEQQKSGPSRLKVWKQNSKIL